MEDENADEVLAKTSSLFPPPPPFYHLYTSERPEEFISGGVELETDVGIVPNRQGGKPEVSSEESGSEDGLQRRLWAPPPPPADDKPYIKFGQLHKASPEEHVLPEEVDKLFTGTVQGNNISFAQDLRSLNRRGMQKYIELLEVLTDDPASDMASRVENIAHIFHNITHLLNLMRPHQARQTIISVLQKQLQDSKSQADELLKSVDEARSFLAKRGVVFEEAGTGQASAKALKSSPGEAGCPGSSVSLQLRLGSEKQHKQQQEMLRKQRERESALSELLGRITQEGVIID